MVLQMAMVPGHPRPFLAGSSGSGKFAPRRRRCDGRDGTFARQNERCDRAPNDFIDIHWPYGSIWVICTDDF